MTDTIREKNHTASILDGKFVSNELKKRIQHEIHKRVQQGEPSPGLAVILLGDDPASCIYVNAKRQACENLGITSFSYHLPVSTSERTLLTLIDQLNEDDAVHGILIQLPLPQHIETQTIIERIKPEKDVDGFHPYNFGRLAQGNPYMRPCTPYGIIQLLHFYDLELSGKRAVVVGASNIVGRPMALEFLLAKSTVTICHRATEHLDQHVQSADIIVVGTGKPDLIKPEWLNKNQILIDVGIQRLSNGKVRGEIDFEHAKNRVAWITPVPGGVGPMTICMLLHNTLLAAQQQCH